MRKIAVATLAVVLLLAAGCSTGSTYTPVNTVTPEPTLEPTATMVFDVDPPVDRTWISPGMVQVGNFYSGARAEWPLTIHNGNDYITEFLVRYRYPDHVGTGYEKPTQEVQDWLIISDATPVIAAYGTIDVLITLEMPYDATSPGHKWEFWLSIFDTNQTNFLQKEVCSRWQIIMK